MKCNCNGRTYPLRATNYTLCIECGRQFQENEGIDLNILLDNWSEAE